MNDIDSAEFERLVIAQLDLLPDDVLDRLENVAFVTEDRPDDGSLDLLGEYDGVDLTRRGDYGFGELPDRIVLYREPLLSVSADIEQLNEQIHVTLVHEIGHYFGIDDAELHDLGWG
jgi:predicted Zn-dependent protease with MMP-like domain